MDYYIKNNRITIFYPAPKREKPKYLHLKLTNCQIPDKQLEPFIVAACNRYEGQSFESKSMIRVSLGSFIRFICEKDKELPYHSYEWQEFILSMLRWFLINKKSKQSLKSRLNGWNHQIVQFLLLCQDRDLIPLDVEIPKAKTKEERTNAKKSKLLGEIPPRKARKTEELNKLLITIDYTKSDADYLDEVHLDCLNKVSILKKVCLNHFQCIKHDRRTGKILASKTPKKEIIKIIESNQYFRKNAGGIRTHKMRVESFGEPALSLILSYFFHILETTDSPKCITMRYLNNNFFPSDQNFIKGPLLTSAGRFLKQYSALNKEQCELLKATNIFYRFLGLLNNLDMAVLCCLLIIEHPQFNPYSLTNAKLLNTKGKFYILTGDDNKSSIFSVDKPRANSRKTSVLTPLSKKIIEFIISSTSRVRQILKSNNDPNWRYLFLGTTRNSGILSALIGETSTYLSSSKSNNCLIKLYPELTENGLGANMLTLSSLRTTLGVLRWFETGSISEASKVLGNSTKVCLEYYIPAALLYAWNVRLVRRFQQTLITLACHDKEYLFKISDFSNFSDLTLFIDQLIYEAKYKKDPISKEITFRLSNNEKNKNVAILNEEEKSVESLLNINLSPCSLAALYCYEEIAMKMSSHTQQTKDPLTSLTPKHFIDLSRMLKHIAEGDNISYNFGEQVDYTDLKICHKKAMIEKSIIRETFKKMILKNKWSSTGGLV